MTYRWKIIYVFNINRRNRKITKHGCVCESRTIWPKMIKMNNQRRTMVFALRLYLSTNFIAFRKTKTSYREKRSFQTNGQWKKRQVILRRFISHLLLCETLKIRGYAGHYSVPLDLRRVMEADLDRSLPIS